MKYPKLNSLVPQGEHFDESAIAGEGVWLSTGHVGAIETALATLVADNSETLETANNTIAEHVQTIATLQSEATAAASRETALNARITELETENKNLGAQSSGTGTVLPVEEDPKVIENSSVPSYLDESNPINQWLDKRLGSKKKTN